MRLTRNHFLQGGIALAAGAGASLGGAQSVFAAQPEPLGTFPAGTSTDSILIGINVALTGSFSADSADLLNGYKLAIDDLNNGTGVMARVPSLAGKKGILGKHIRYKVADTETKANPAIQNTTNFISQDKAILIVGAISSAVAIALEKLAQREKVLYMVGTSGANETTGIDCQRYGFRSAMDADMIARGLGPLLVARLGRNRKAAYLLPDYAYGHSLTEALANLTERLGWKTVAKVVAPFPTSDYSSYLTNIANSGADVFFNNEFGNDAIASTKQAAQFGILKQMKLVLPYVSPYMPDAVGQDLIEGAFGALDWYFTMEGNHPLSRAFANDFSKKFGERPRWTAAVGYTELMMWADAVTRANTFYPIAVIKELEAERPVDTILGPVHYRAGDHQLVKPVPIVVGKQPSQMKAKDDFFDVAEIVPARKVMPPLAATKCTLPGYI